MIREKTAFKITSKIITTFVVCVIFFTMFINLRQQKTLDSQSVMSPSLEEGQLTEAIEDEAEEGKPEMTMTLEQKLIEKIMTQLKKINGLDENDLKKQIEFLKVSKNINEIPNKEDIEHLILPIPIVETPVVEEKPKWIWTTFNVSAYCPCERCCGKSTGITASGAKAQEGITIAMGKKYAFGTKVEIQGYGMYIVQDRGRSNFRQ